MNFVSAHRVDAIGRTHYSYLNLTRARSLDLLDGAEPGYSKVKIWWDENDADPEVYQIPNDDFNEWAQKQVPGTDLEDWNQRIEMALEKIAEALSGPRLVK